MWSSKNELHTRLHDRTPQNRELLAQQAEPHAAEVEGVRVERLEIEVGALALPGVVSALQPHAFADLVADRLARPSEVTVDLAAHELLGETAALDHERQRELGRPRLARVVALVRRNRQLQMHADVDDDAHRAHRLRGQHSHLPRGIVEVAELSHQTFGVQRPALAVTRDEAHQPLKAREPFGRDTSPGRPAGDDRGPLRGNRCSLPSTAESASHRASGTTYGPDARSPRSGPCSTSQPRRRAARSSPRSVAGARRCRSARR